MEKGHFHTHAALSLKKNSNGNPLNTKVGGTQVRSGCFGDENLLSLSGIATRLLDRIARLLVTVPAELPLSLLII